MAEVPRPGETPGESPGESRDSGPMNRNEPGSSPETRAGGRRSLLFLSMAGGAAGSAVAAGGLLFRFLTTPELVVLLGGATLLWWTGSPAVPPALRPLHRAIPLVTPLVGPVLAAAGALFFFLFRKSDYLSDDPTYLLIFNPPPVKPSRKILSLEEVLERDRKIVPAGDILRWGDIPLKQALIDRLAGGEITPRVIRILRGAGNDPEEEVRLFATTILTRIEKGFQERIRSLTATPDPLSPFGALGRASLEYAESGLVGERLSRALLVSALEEYRKALAAKEGLSPRELLQVGSAASSLGDQALVERIREVLREKGAREEVSALERILLYEEGHWERLAQEAAQGEGKPEGKGPLPQQDLLWSEILRAGEVRP